MKGDYTRENNNLGKGYSAVRMQQGRVQLDSDWNEQVEIELQKQRQMLTDIIGKAGAPLWGPVRPEDGNISVDSRQILVAQDDQLSIAPSFLGIREFPLGFRCYVDGEIVEQEFRHMSVTLDAVAVTDIDYTIHVPQLEFSDGRALAVNMTVVLYVESPYFEASVFDKIKSVNVAAKTITMEKDNPSRDLPAGLKGALVLLYSYVDQPYYPDPPALSSSTTYLAYLEVWRRHITAIEDPNLREVALGGVDTTTRLKPIWQLKVIPFAATDLPSLADGSWVDKVAWPAPGSLTARYVPAPGQAQALENRLYRVEIHRGGKLSAGDAVTFKWSRDNGSQLAAWTRGNGPIEVATQGREEALGFAKGQWLELSSDAHELKCVPGSLVQITEVPTAIDGGLSLKLLVPPGADSTFANYPGHPKVRRWDGGGVTYPLSIVPATPGGFISLENGIEVQFDPNATYVEGDYWLIPARTNLSGIDWPQVAGQPLPKAAQRNEHKYIALSTVKIGTFDRVIAPSYFLSLTNILQLLKTPQEHIINIVPRFYRQLFDSTPRVEWKNVLRTTDGENYALADSGTDFTSGSMPISFPDHAVITEFSVYWETIGGSVNATCELLFRDFTDGTESQVIGINETAGMLMQKKTKTLSHKVRTDGAYVISATAFPATTTRIRGITIKYTTPVFKNFDRV